MKTNCTFKKLFGLVLSLLLFATISYAQTNIFPSTGSAGIGTTTPNASSALEIKSTTQGLLISRMTKTQRDAIISPTEGLMIYQTNNTPGFYYYTGIAWTAVTPKSKGWLLTGNSGTNPAINYIGTADPVDFVIRTNNQERMRILSGGKIGIGTNSPVFKLDVKDGSINTDSLYRIGGNAVLSINGTENTFVGIGSGFSNTTGSQNTANGKNALYFNTTGSQNTANGEGALYLNTTGIHNTANGERALYLNTTGSYNTANGMAALHDNTTGNQNTANGIGAMELNTTGNLNTAIGLGALQYNIAGSNATAIGALAMNHSNSQSAPFINYSVAVGYEALKGTVSASSNTGNYNTSIGYQTLQTNSTGNNNTATGYNALFNNTEGNKNTVIGSEAGYSVTTGSSNTFIGANANCGASGTLSNSTAIGNGATVTGSDIFVFGNSSVIGWGFGVEPGIRALKVGTTSSNGNSAYLTVGGTWTNASARSKKEDFQKQDRNMILDKINQLEVTKWKYKGTDKEYHYGPMADDFYRLFKVGDDSSISDMDKTGVLFLGMQALSKINAEKDAKINELEARLAKLEAMLNAQSTTNYKQKTTNLSSASLEQNIPNPFNHTTTINYTLPQTYSSAKIIVTDKSGKTLKEVNISAKGKGSLQIDASTLAGGAYNYSLYVDGKLIATKQMEHIH